MEDLTLQLTTPEVVRARQQTERCRDILQALRIRYNAESLQKAVVRALAVQCHGEITPELEARARDIFDAYLDGNGLPEEIIQVYQGE